MRAIAIYENAWGPEHPYTAMARARLAAVDQRAGDGPRADAALRQSLDILENALGTDHLWYVRCLTTQSNVRVDAHDVEKAEALRREAVAILERTQNTETIQYAVALHNLADVYLIEARLHARARICFNARSRSPARSRDLRAIASARSFRSLAIIARDEKDYARALDYDTRALAIRERILGANHADIAPLLNNIAVIYHVTGDDAKALPLFFRALDIREKTVGPYHTGHAELGEQHRQYLCGDRRHRAGDRIRTARRGDRRKAARPEPRDRLGAAEACLRAGHHRAHGPDDLAAPRSGARRRRRRLAGRARPAAAQGPRAGCDDRHVRSVSAA